MKSNIYIRLTFLLSTLFLLVINVSSQWEIKNGSLSSSFNSVFFVSSNDGWAVASKGGIYHYDGTTWEKVSLPFIFESDLNDVYFTSATHGWIVGSSGMLLEYTNGQWKTWDVSQYVYYLYQVFFISENDGWIRGSGTTLLHYNGTDWQPVNITGVDAITSISFVNANLGYATTYNYNNVDYSYNGKIYKYDGATWTLENSADYKKQNLSDIFMLDETHGWAVGESGYALKYNGTDWVKDSITTGYLSSVYFTDAEHGWACGNGQYLYKYDSSMWKQVRINEQNWTWYDLRSLAFVNSNDAWAAGSTLLHYNGTIWEEYRIGNLSASFNDVDMVAEDKAWIVGGQGSIVKFDNNKLTDYSIPNYGHDYIHVNFPDSLTGIAVSYYGGISIYKNGNWYSKSTYGTDYLMDAFFFDTTKGWAVGYSGAIYKYSNEEWVKQEKITDYYLTDVFFLDENTGWAVGGNGTILMYENGKWAKQVSNTDYELSAVCFTDKNNGWAAGQSGMVLKYTNGLWQKVDLNTYSSFYSITFNGPKNGWMTSYGGVVFKFDGNSWTTMNTETSTSLLDADFFDNNAGLIVGDNATILYTQSGGIDTTKYTSVSILGTIANRTTFNTDTIKILGNVTWNNNLIIPAGTVVEFQGSYSLQVQGKLTAIGTPTDSIIFTIHDTAGFSNIYNYDGSWGYVNIYYKTDTSKLEYCKFLYSKNYTSLYLNAGNAKVSHCDFENIYGGISANNLNGGIIENNQINTRSGTAISLDQTKNLIIKNNDIQSNSGQNGISINNCIDLKITGNTIHKNATGIYASGSIISLINNKIVNNDYRGLYISDSKASIINNLICNNGYNSTGAGIYSENSILKVTNSTIANNRSYNSGGAGIYFKFTNGDIINSILWNNRAGEDTNQVYIFNNGSKPNFYNCDIEGGKEDFETFNGDVVYSGIYKDNLDSLPKFNLPTSAQGFDSNEPASDYSLQNVSPCLNMGIFDYSNLSLPATDLAGNDRILNGVPDLGAYERRILPFNATCDTLKGNVIWAADTIRIKTCDVIVHKKATLKIMPGTIIEFWGPYKLIIQGSVKATGIDQDPIRFTYFDTTGYWKNDSTGWRGIDIDNSLGLLDNSDSSTFENCLFEYAKVRPNTSNYAENDGIFRVTNFSKLAFRNCEFRYNATMPEYDYETQGIFNFKRSEASFYNCQFYNNAAPMMCLYLGKTNIEKCTFSYNSIYPIAGAYKPKYSNFFNLQTSEISVKNTLFANNRTNQGSLFYTSSSDGVWDNNLIVNNGSDSTDWSGAIYGYGGNLTVINNTIANNKYLGIYTYYSTLKVYNNIVWGHSYYYSSYAYMLNAGSEVTNNNIQQYWYTDAFNENNISDTPRFVMPSAGTGPAYDGVNANWQLTQFSPCVNKGKTEISGISLQTNDFAGNKRIIGDMIDIGAFELFGNKPLITKQPVNLIACSGENAVFTVETADTANIQWQKEGVDIPGQKSNNLVIPNATTENEGNYGCVISTAFGTVQSNNVYLLIKMPPSIINPSSSWVSLNSDYRITVPTSGTAPFTYEWMKNEIIMGQNTNELSISEFDNADEGIYKCKVTNLCGSDSINPVNLYIEPSLVNANPEAICPGSSFTLSIHLNDSATYQWLKDGQELYTATNDTFTLSAVTEKDAGFYNCRISNGYATNNTYSVNLKIKQAPIINSSPLSTWMPENASYSFALPVIGTEPISYVWKKNNIALSDSIAKLEIDSFKYSNEGIYSCVISNACGNASIKPFYLFVEPKLINNNPEVICTGGKFKLSISTNDIAKYQWRKDGNNIPGATKKDLTISPITENSSGNYSCVVNSSYGQFISGTVLLQPKKSPTIIAQSQNAFVGYNNQAVLSVSATGSEPIYYSWIKDKDPIQNATSSTVLLHNLTLTDEVPYYCTISNMCDTIASDSINIAFAPQICMVTFDSTSNKNLVTWEKNSKYIFDHYNIYREGSVSGYYEKIGEVNYYNLTVFEDTLVNPKSQAFLYKITATDTLDNETSLDACFTHKTIHLLVTKGVPTGYQLDWDEYFGFPYGQYLVYRSVDGNPFEMVHPHSATTRTWTDFDAPDGYLQYFVSVEKAGGCYPDPATLKSSAGPFAQAMSNMEDNRLRIANTIAISKHPDNQLLCTGSSAQLSVEATGSNLQYSWYKNGLQIPGETGTNLDLLSISFGDEGNYYCIVKNSDVTAQSNNAYLSVKSKPVILIEPGNTWTQAGDPVKLTVAASGTYPMSYQWFKENNYIQGSDKASIEISAFALSDTGTYFSIVTNACGQTYSQQFKLNALNSNAVPEVLSHPMNMIKYAGELVKFEIIAKNASSYQWQKDGIDISNATGSSYTINNISSTDEGNYNCVVKNTAGQVKSNNAYLLVKQAVQITAQPLSLTKCLGDSATFKVEASGANLSYVWYKDNNEIQGATTASIKLSPIGISTEGNYQCLVKNSYGQVLTNMAYLVVKYPPDLSILLNNVFISKGNAGAISVSAPGTMPMSYQWYKNNSAITNAKSSVLSFPIFADKDTGTYVCKVKNTCAEITSQAIVVKAGLGTVIDNTKSLTDLQVFPNPFSNLTNIVYQINKPSDVKLEVLNIIGQVVFEPVNHKQFTGEYRYSFGNGFKPGIYTVKLTVDGFAINQKIVMVK